MFSLHQAFLPIFGTPRAEIHTSAESSACILQRDAWWRLRKDSNDYGTNGNEVTSKNHRADDGEKEDTRDCQQRRSLEQQHEKCANG